MADEIKETKLTEEQSQKILDAILEKWTSPRVCPICGTDHWTLAQHVTTPLGLKGMTGDIQMGGDIYPKAQIVCINCGFTHHFNLVSLKIFPSKADSKQTPESSPKEAADVRK